MSKTKKAKKVSIEEYNKVVDKPIKIDRFIPVVAKYDSIHFNWTHALSYNKTWNFAVCERTAGKSVASWMLLWHSFWYYNSPSIVFRRRTVDISTVYIDDVENLLNKFLIKPIKLVYKKGDVKQGVVDVRVGEQGVNYSWQALESLPVFFRVIAISNPIGRIKSLMLPNIRWMFWDEFIINLRAGEKYVSDEFFRLQEIYTTFCRESPRLRIIAAANPYSVYCPFFTGLKVDTAKLKPGAFVVGDDYVIDCFQVPDELKKKLMKENPMLQFSDDYKRYAFNGEAINDANIKRQKREPKGFKLKFVFKIGNNYLTLHRRSDTSLIKEKWWVCSHNSDWVRKVSKNRRITVFNFGDMDENCKLPNLSDRRDMMTFNDAMRNNEVCYNTVEAKYMAEDVFNLTR